MKNEKMINSFDEFNKLKLNENEISSQLPDIFDKDGEKLHLPSLIYSFIEDRARKYNKDVSDIYVGVSYFWPSKKAFIYTSEAVNNSYDAIDLNEFGDELEVIDTNKNS